MKAVSASIVALAGAVLLAAAALVSHSDTQLFVGGVGCGVGLLGLVSWIISLGRPEP